MRDLEWLAGWVRSLLGAALLAAGVLGFELLWLAWQGGWEGTPLGGAALARELRILYPLSLAALLVGSWAMRRAVGTGHGPLLGAALRSTLFAFLAVATAVARALSTSGGERFLCAAPAAGGVEVAAPLWAAAESALLLAAPVLPLLLAFGALVGAAEALWTRARRPWSRRAPLQRAAALLLATLFASCGPADSVSDLPPGEAAVLPPSVLDGACAPDAPRRFYAVSAISIDMTLNRFGDHDKGAYMFALDSAIPAIRAQERAPLPERVSVGLRKDPIQPLVLRANVGDCVEVSFTNRLSSGRASFNVHGVGTMAFARGGHVGLNSDSTVGPGERVSYVLAVPKDGVAERAYYIRDGGASRARVSHGLFGVLVAEPAGANWLDPETGAPLMTSNWEAMIDMPPGAPDFREYVLIYHEIGDESFDEIVDARGDRVPRVDDEAGVYRPASRALNYRSEPFRNRLQLRSTEALAYGSYTFGDPATPTPRSYLGEPTKTRLIHAGTEVFHVHHLHGGGDRWRRNPRFEASDFATGLTKLPVQNAASVRLDSQTIGPGTSFNLEHECGAGGCQQVAGDFLYHCHVQHHYLSGMWAFWRVFDTRQSDLAQLPDRAEGSGMTPIAVDSTELLGRVIEGKRLVRRGEVVDPQKEMALEEFIEAQLPPPGERLDEDDATVWDWVVRETEEGPLYLGEPETRAVWANYRSPTPGARPTILFNPNNGRYAWPLFRPHLAQRPPFSGNGHTPAPWLGEVGTLARPDGLCPDQEVLPVAGRRTRYYPISGISTQVPVTPSVTDNDGLIFVLNEERDRVASDPSMRRPLVIRSNVGDCVQIILTNEIPDIPINKFDSRLNLHTHFVQFDPQSSDGVITGLSYEQSVKPYKEAKRTLQVAARAGEVKLEVTNIDALRVGIWLGIGLGEGLCPSAENDQRPCTEIRRIAALKPGEIFLDRALEVDHAIGEHVGVEFARSAWYSDVDSGSVFWHDHIQLGGWAHGLFGTHIIEPAGSTYHDPKTGAELRSGPIADIHTPPDASVGAGQRGPFREIYMGISDQGGGGDAEEAPSKGTINLRAEPLDRRGGEPSQRFSSVLHGDPFTMVPRAYVGDPVVVRGVGVINIVSAIHVTGHRFRINLFGDDADLSDTAPIGISERFDLVLDGGAGGPAGKPGDYLFYEGLGRNLLEGAWGLLRVHDTLQGDLRPLPGRTPRTGAGFPSLSFTGKTPPPAGDAGRPCPPNAPIRRYDVQIDRADIRYSDDEKDSGGLVYSLLRSGEQKEALEPLAIRARVGECVELQLFNRLNDPAALTMGKLPFDPQGSYGAAIGLNPDSSVPRDGSRLFRFYADRELGTSLFVNLADPESAARGAFGALIVEPADATWVDSRSGRPIDSGIRATVQTATGSFREFVTLWQDEDDRIGENQMPYPTEVDKFTGISYSAESFKRRDAEKDPDRVFDSNTHGDPRLLFTANVGDRVTFRVAQGWGEQGHVFALEGHRFPLESRIPKAEQLYARNLLPGSSFEAILTDGAGGESGATGDFLLEDLRAPFTEAGLWGILRVFPEGAGGLVPIPAANRTPPVETTYLPPTPPVGSGAH